jgi:cyd operon protein YbgT
MWYFSWILGVLLACAFAIMNALWLESLGGPDGGGQSDASADAQ